MGIITEEEITNILKKKDLSNYPNLTEMQPITQVLWILEIVKDNTNVKKITAKTASFILTELKEIDVNETTILRALSRAGKKVKTYKEDGKFYYEIMASGRKFIRDNLPIDFESGVYFFTGKDSWSDPNKNFPNIIKKLEGNLCVVDPYYGNGTFYVLEKFEKQRKIRFLSCRLGDEEQRNITQFNINLKRFRKEFKNIEMRKYDKPYELHDRYIIADNALVVIGHGIKDLADKESFVIFLPKNFVAKFLPTIKKTFEERWKKSNNLN